MFEFSAIMTDVKFFTRRLTSSGKLGSNFLITVLTSLMESRPSLSVSIMLKRSLKGAVPLCCLFRALLNSRRRAISFIERPTHSGESEISCTNSSPCISSTLHFGEEQVTVMERTFCRLSNSAVYYVCMRRGYIL